MQTIKLNGNKFGAKGVINFCKLIFINEWLTEDFNPSATFILQLLQGKHSKFDIKQVN